MQSFASSNVKLYIAQRKALRWQMITYILIFCDFL